MDPSPEQPAERPLWHLRSGWHYISAGLAIAVGGGLLLVVVRVVFFGGEPDEVKIQEAREVIVDEADEVTVKADEVTIEDASGGTVKQPADPAPTTEPSPETTAEPTADDWPTAGDCGRFHVYAQGRLTPLGAAVRSEPTVVAPKTASRQPNVVISVDGWIRSDAPYPDNPEPWNENVWFRLTDRSGWVSFAGVRAATSHADGTDGPAGGGQPVELKNECEILAPTE